MGSDRPEAYRDASKGAEEPGQSSQVFEFNSEQRLARGCPWLCYPNKSSLLTTSPLYPVKLTFKNPAGDEAAVDDSLRNGQIRLDVDPRLDFPPSPDRNRVSDADTAGYTFNSAQVSIS